MHFSVLCKGPVIGTSQSLEATHPASVTVFLVDRFTCVKAKAAICTFHALEPPPTFFFDDIFCLNPEGLLWYTPIIGTPSLLLSQLLCWNTTEHVWSSQFQKLCSSTPNSKPEDLLSITTYSMFLNQRVRYGQDVFKNLTSRLFLLKCLLGNRQIQ